MAGGWCRGSRMRRSSGRAGPRPLPAHRPHSAPRRAAAVSIRARPPTRVSPGVLLRAERAYRWLVYARSARRSRIVVTLSEYAAVTIVDRLGIPDERVRLIPLGIDHALFRPMTAPSQLPALSRARVAAQEPRVSVRGIRRLAQKNEGWSSCSPPTTVPCPRRPLARAVSRAELVDLYRSSAAVVFPICMRALASRRSRRWHAVVRSPARTPARYQRSWATRRVFSIPPRSRKLSSRSRRCSTSPGLAAPRLALAARSTSEAMARAHDDVYKEYLLVMPPAREASTDTPLTRSLRRAPPALHGRRILVIAWAALSGSRRTSSREWRHSRPAPARVDRVRRMRCDP